MYHIIIEHHCVYISMEQQYVYMVMQISELYSNGVSVWL